MAASAIPALIQYLEDDLYGSRGSFALRRIGVESIPYLTAALKESENTVIRRASARNFEHFAAENGVVEALTDALDDRELDVRLGAATALLYSGVKNEQIASVFVEGLQHDEPFSRYISVLELSKCGETARSAVSALQSAAANDPELAGAVDFALAKIRGE
jgi:HEAT repeat protein